MCVMYATYAEIRIIECARFLCENDARKPPILLLTFKQTLNIHMCIPYICALLSNVPKRSRKGRSLRKRRQRVRERGRPL